MRDRNRILKLVIEEKRQKKIYNLATLEKLKRNNKSSKEHLPLFEQKVELLGNRVDMRRDNITRIKQTHFQRQEELKVIVKQRIHQLITFIFPITTVKPSQ